MFGPDSLNRLFYHPDSPTHGFRKPPQMAPRISISIVSHHQAALVHNLLSDLESIKLENAEVILTVNVPGEQNDLPQDLSLPTTIVENPRPRGFGANHNAAFAISKGEFFCVLNPDIRITGDPFPALVEYLARPSVGVVAPRVLDSKGKIEDNARRFPTPFRILAKVFALGAGVSPKSISSCPDWVAGSFMLFRRDAFSEVGGFDERYFLYYEDVDICARLRVTGRDVALCESVEVIHDARRDSHNRLRYFFWHLRSMMRFFLTWPQLAFGFGVSRRND